MFNKDKIKQLFLMLILFGFGVSVGLFTPLQNQSAQNTQIEEPIIVGQSEDEKTIPELIADQLISGDLDCQGLSPLRTEGCLLFQGTLGVWKRIGMPEACPTTSGGNEDKTIEVSQDQKILPEDVTRANRSPCFGYLYAINVANTVPVLINTSNYIFHKINGLALNQPGSDAEQCMAVRRGICGNHAAVGLSLFEMVGIKARPIEFYYSKNGQRYSHIIVEAEIDGEYRPIDTTYGAYWLNLIPEHPLELMPTDLLIDSNRIISPIWNSALLPYGFYSQYQIFDWFEYLRLDPDIIRGGKGEVRIKIDESIMEENFKDIPNFIGDNQYDSYFGGISFVFTGNKGTIRNLRISVTSFAFSANDLVELCVDQECQAFSADKKDYDFSVSDPERIYLDSSMDVAYLVLEKIWWDSNSAP